MRSPRGETSVERWGLYELRLQGPSHGNPFTELRFGASFALGHRAVEVDGFYDGDGVYCVRFSPDTEGTWTCTTRSDVASLDGHTASFRCITPSAGNHGPVRVAHTYHFQYEDGTPYRQIGTTCYAWVHQGSALEEQTLATLRTAPFNKLRMCVFPKHYRYNENEPELFPFARQADGSWDWERFDPAFWRHLEGRVADLLSLGIEADVILFHPYDRWGFATMDAETDDRYLRYTVARLGAYRNVWWSMANEYDLMTAKSVADWDRFFRIVQQADPYHHPRSIHNCRGFYDHAKPWVTHASVQHWDLSRALEWREAYGKPVINDECQYGGTSPTSGATSPRASWCTASGSGRWAVCTWATGRRTCTLRRSCGGPRVGCCTGRARPAWPSSARSSKRAPWRGWSRRGGAWPARPGATICTTRGYISRPSGALSSPRASTTAPSCSTPGR